MKSEEFADYFKILDKSSDRARTVIYVFIIVYVAMLLYAISAFAYPTSQLIYDKMTLQARCLFTDSADLNSVVPNCDTVRPDLENESAAPLLKAEMKQHLWEHQIQVVYDDSVKLRTFTFPVFGLQTDRDLLWVLFPIIGIVGYYIVLLALGSLFSMFEFLRNENKAEPFRLRMIQSTLMITLPLGAIGRDNRRHARDADVAWLFKYPWRILACAVFAIPLIVSVLMLADQANAIAHFFRDPKAKMLDHPTFAFECELHLEVVLLVFQALLFRALIKLAVAFGTSQKRVAAVINPSKGRLAAPPGFAQQPAE